MSQPTTVEQIDAMAALMVASRPGWVGWDYASCRVAVIDAGNISKDFQTLLRALGALLDDTTIKRPEVLAMRGDHWRNAGLLYAPAEPRQRRRCEHCHTATCPGALDDDGKPICAAPPAARPYAAAARARLALYEATHKEPEQETATT